MEDETGDHINQWLSAKEKLKKQLSTWKRREENCFLLELRVGKLLKASGAILGINILNHSAIMQPVFPEDVHMHVTAQ